MTRASAQGCRVERVTRTPRNLVQHRLMTWENVPYVRGVDVPRVPLQSDLVPNRAQLFQYCLHCHRARRVISHLAQSRRLAYFVTVSLFHVADLTAVGPALAILAQSQEYVVQSVAVTQEYQFVVVPVDHVCLYGNIISVDSSVNPGIVRGDADQVAAIALAEVSAALDDAGAHHVFRPAHTDESPIREQSRGIVCDEIAGAGEGDAAEVNFTPGNVNYPTTLLRGNLGYIKIINSGQKDITWDASQILTRAEDCSEPAIDSQDGRL
ncbi:unnamed protein product [Leptosia nina]|uniref:Uncharacterized protein n=1 Tax=Leptosia nina TaxID=320188 RepID=A0AAV1J843_9NEOP